MKTMGGRTMAAVRELLPSPTAHVLELGAGAGQRRTFLPETVSYLGIDIKRFKGYYPHGAVLVGDYLNNECFPAGMADVAIFVDYPRFPGKEGVLLHRLTRAIKSNGAAFVSWVSTKTIDTSLFSGYFKTVRIYTDDYIELAELRVPIPSKDRY